ncbi:MAG: hypothetical protein MI724_00295 [Spirochaetales bacterium]|nr:hypothetical protein [Spirochaetales bacterium]
MFSQSNGSSAVFDDSVRGSTTGTGDRVDESDSIALHRRIAISLVDEALALGFDFEYRVLPGAEETVAALLARANTLDPHLADAAFLLSQLAATDRRSTRRRERLLQEALGGDLAVVERGSVVETLADLYLRQGRGREALTLIDEEFRDRGGLSPVMALFPAVDAPDVGPPRAAFDVAPGRLHHLHVRALLAVGPRWYSSNYLRRLYDRFPEDQETGLIWWERRNRISLGFLEWLDAAERDGGIVSPAVYLHAVRHAPDPLLSEFTRRYYEAGGTDTLPAALTLVAGDRFLDSRYAASVDDRAVEAFFFSDKIIWEAVYHSVNGVRGALPSDIAPFADAVEGDFRGETTLVVDDDRDLFWEERYTIRSGELVAWQSDEDRNGYVDTAALFSPRGIRILIAEGGAYHVVEYASYPLVRSVMRLAGDDAVVWTPSRPVAFDAGLRVVAGRTLVVPDRESTLPIWETLGGRVRLEDGVAERFARQLGSDDARIANDEERAAATALLSEWELMQ